MRKTGDILTTKETLKSKKLFIFDLDGTVYLGARVFPFAVDFINRLRESGRRVLFFTNNASHSANYYYEKLGGMGFSPRDGEIMTSGDVTASFLRAHRSGERVYLVGTPELEETFRRAGIAFADSHNRTADIVVTSFDTTLTYEKLNAACRFIRGGAEYLCTHPDYNCPTEDGFIPDSGAIAALVTASTGVSPRYFGKPYADTAAAIAEATGVDASGMCVFGDRLYTDIALGKRYGMTAVLVYSGETTREMVEAAADCDKPDFAFADLSEVDRYMFG